MAMVISLRTNQQNQVLEISRVNPDSFTLFVDSHGFSGSSGFYHYDTSWLNEFLQNMELLEARKIDTVTLAGVEGNKLKFDLDKLGHVEASGHLVQHNIPGQELNFGSLPTKLA